MLDYKFCDPKFNYVTEEGWIERLYREEKKTHWIERIYFDVINEYMNTYNDRSKAKFCFVDWSSF